ncbi:microtubule associated protein-domain-containing protein [Gongronella butleri]|nr:microtubule associated protein-domain-containing protein [Gongronella butleri]
MSINDLIQQLTPRLESLKLLHKELGTPEDKQKEKLKQLCASLVDLADDHVSKVAHERDSTEQQCKENYNEMARLKKLMGEQPDDLPANMGPPWLATLEQLDAKREIVQKHYEKRLVDVKELHQRLREHEASLGDFVQMYLVGRGPIDVSLPTVTALEEEIRRCDNEYVRRAQQVDLGAETIVELWDVLGQPATSPLEKLLFELHQEQQVDRRVHLYSQLIKESQLNAIVQLIGQLEEIKQQRDFRKQEIMQLLYRLWDRLQIDDEHRAHFIETYKGCTAEDVQAHEDELDHMLQLKSERVQDFILDARNEMENLWNQLYLSQQERDTFAYFHSDEYTDTLLQAHETEVERLKHLVEDRKYILDKVERHMKLLQELRDFEESTNDPKRLFGKGQRDPGRLLREEKFRKRMARDLPRSTHDLEGALVEFETSTGSPFTVFGERYLDTLAAKTDQTSATPRRFAPAAFEHPPMTSPRPRATTRLHFHTPQAPRTAAVHLKTPNAAAEPAIDTKTEWRKMQTQVSAATNMLHRVRQTGIRKRQRQTQRKTRRTSGGSSSGSSSSGATTLIDKKENIDPVPASPASTRPIIKKRAVAASNAKRPLVFEDDPTLDLAIFDDGPELSDMSDA